MKKKQHKIKIVLKLDLQKKNQWVMGKNPKTNHETVTKYILKIVSTDFLKTLVKRKYWLYSSLLYSVSKIPPPPTLTSSLVN